MANKCINFLVRILYISTAFLVPILQASVSSSTNYSLQEVSLTSIAGVQATSTNYSILGSVGGIVSSTKSTSADYAHRNGFINQLTTAVVPPVVVSITPAFGLTSGGSLVTISGSHFTGANSVTIGTEAATSVTVLNDTTITALTPLGIAGYADIAVAIPNAIGDSAGLFTYYTPTYVRSALTASGTVGSTFTYSITGAGGSGNYLANSFSAAPLPSGLIINPASGVISGIPTSVSTTNISIGFQDALGFPASTATLALTISPSAVITPTKIAAGISITNTTQIYTGLPLPVTTALSPSNLNAAVVYYPGFSVPTQAGTYYVLVNVVDNAYYGSQSSVLTILPSAQTLSIGAPLSLKRDSSDILSIGIPILLSAKASSNGPVVYSIESGNATLVGSILTILDANPVTIMATQVGSNNYLPASATITLKATADSTNGGTTTPPVTLIAPSITTQPASQTVLAGVSTTFSVVAEGTAPTYQWYFNDTAISGATTSTYTIVSPLNINAGFYTVIVANSAGSVTSSPAVLTVNTAPSIVTQPSSMSAVSGNTATFTVVATGTAPLTYQWLKNGVVIPSATTASLTLSSVPSKDATSYSVIVTNLVGSVTSSEATLTVTPLVLSPTISTQPNSLTIAQGSLASFTVISSGSGTLSYQWYVNGNLIIGATSSTYTINSTSASDAGTYTATVTNLAGSISSNAAVLSFNGLAPRLTIVATSNLNINIGQSATFSAIATGTGVLSYQWYLNGQLIAGANSSSYIIPIVVLKDSGNYTVSVTNNYGSATSNQLTLAVNQLPAPPLFSAQLINQSVVTGGSFTLSANVTAAGQITYQWYLNGQQIAGATSSSYTVARATEANAGTYIVTAMNAGGTSTSSALLNVITKDRLYNLSARSVVGASNLVVGFVSSGSAEKSLLLRGVAPALNTYGVSGVLASPVLTLYNTAGTPLASNSAWGGSSTLSNTFTQVGAFPLATTSSDTALLQSLPSGAYTAIVSGANSSTGAAMVEIYDADQAGATSRLLNISARGMVGSGSSIMTGGFVITGKTTETVLIRAVGPSLVAYGVTGVLLQPTLTVYNSAGNPVASNTVWGGGSILSSAMTQVGAFALPSTSADSAVLLTLPAGAYTVQVSGVGGTMGNALIEIYEVSSP